MKSIDYDDNDDDELFLWYCWPTKSVQPCFQSGSSKGSSPSRMSDTQRARLESGHYLSSGFDE